MAMCDPFKHVKYCWFNQKTKNKRGQILLDLRAPPIESLRFFSYVKSHFFNYTSTNSLFKKHKNKRGQILLDLIASLTDSLRFSSYVESSPHIESHFFNYTPTNSLFFLYFYSFILTFFLSPHFSFLLRFSPPVTHRPQCASLLNPPDPHLSSKTNKNHHQYTTLLPKSIQNPTTQKTHQPTLIY